MRSTRGPRRLARTAEAQGPRRIELRSQFANVLVEARDVLSFPQGLPGFETHHEFALLDNADTAPIKMLHALSGSELCFFVVDPKTVLPHYRCELAASDRQRLGAAGDDQLLWLAIVTIAPNGQISANLRAPIVINPERMIGRQVIPASGVYPLHHVIAPAE